MAEENFKKDAEKLLKKAVIGEEEKNPQGDIVYPLLVDSEIVGHLKEKVEVNKLEIGEKKEDWRGRIFELLYDGKIVGHLRE